jgi:hypothetical protein
MTYDVPNNDEQYSLPKIEVHEEVKNNGELVRRFANAYDERLGLLVVATPAMKMGLMDNGVYDAHRLMLLMFQADKEGNAVSGGKTFESLMTAEDFGMSEDSLDANDQDLLEEMVDSILRRLQAYKSVEDIDYSDDLFGNRF